MNKEVKLIDATNEQLLAELRMRMETQNTCPMCNEKKPLLNYIIPLGGEFEKTFGTRAQYLCEDCAKEVKGIHYDE